MKTEPEQKEPYQVDDRGNIAQFYETNEFEIVATLDRESEVNGEVDKLTWDGGPSVTEWAKSNGYEESINAATKI